MLRTLVRRAARTTAAARTSPRCLATVDDAKTTERKTLDLSSHQLFGALGLQTFSKDELRAAFDKADLDGDGVINCREAGKIFADSVTCEDRPAAARAVLAHLDRDHDGTISWDEFEKSILEEASTVDTAVYPLAAVMFSGGLSVGTIMPVLPIIVRDLGLGPAEFGLAVGSAPTAAAANAVPEDERAGALALLRVCGDLGLLTGSAGFGALAAAAGSDAAFGAASVLLVGTAARFRYLAPSK